MKTVLTTIELATVLGIPPGSVARWAQRHSLAPRGRVRSGRSWVTVWHVRDVEHACAPGGASACA